MALKPYYLLVTGGRDYENYGLVSTALHHTLMTLPKDRRLVVVHGGARGADSLAARWCDHWDQSEFRITADWNRHGKGAGHVRNQQMLDWLPIEWCIAFPGGSGTADMVERCNKANIEVIHAAERKWK